MTRCILQHLHSSVKGKLPTVSTSDTDSIQYGEIAVNYAKGSETLAIRNANDEIVTFSNSNTFRYGCTNVTTLVNVPIKTRLVYATILTDNTLSIDTSYSDIFTAFPDGVEMKIIAYNSGSSSITITLPWETYTCSVKSLTVNADEYGVFEISFKSESDVYILAEAKQAFDGYTGKYGTVAFSNGTDYRLVQDKDNNLSDFKNSHSDYEPIGILIIPSSCTSVMLPDGDVRKGKNIIMSLCDMSCTTPDSGQSSSEDVGIVFGAYWNYGFAIEYTIVNIYSDGSKQSVISTSEVFGMASDLYTGVASKVYPSIYYNATSGLAPCPFKQVDGELLPNEEYYTTAYSSQNACSDFAGPNNTKTYIDLATSQTDWKTKGVAINSSTDSGYYPAACCCARFGAPDNSSAPKGTNSFLYHYTNNPSYDYTKGVNYTWYFPAYGELGFIMPHYVKNNATLTKLASLYSDIAVYSVNNKRFLWSSTYKGYYWGLVVGNGGTGRYPKNYDPATRVFCAI